MIRILAAFTGLLALPAVAGSDVTVAFSPDGGATSTVVGLIASSSKSIRVAAYGFSSKPIVAALIAAHQKGIDVEAVLDKSNETARYSGAAALQAAGVPVRIDGKYAIMHDKFIVADGATLETGSLNYTRAAEVSNAENILVVRDDPAVAGQYEARWQLLWNESRPYGAKP